MATLSYPPSSTINEFLQQQQKYAILLSTHTNLIFEISLNFFFFKKIKLLKICLKQKKILHFSHQSFYRLHFLSSVKQQAKITLIIIAKMKKLQLMGFYLWYT